MESGLQKCSLLAEVGKVYLNAEEQVPYLPFNPSCMTAWHLLVVQQYPRGGYVYASVSVARAKSKAGDE